MRFGFYLPTRGPTATRDGILTLAREGERLGLHSTMVADHIVFPVESQSTYPYTVDRQARPHDLAAGIWLQLACPGGGRYRPLQASDR
jgi:hypothetical protein